MTTQIVITPQWQGETVAIFASGPSMSRAIADDLRGQVRVIAINNQSFDCAPWADLIYASDAKWWREYWPRVKDLSGRKITVRHQFEQAAVQSLSESTTVIDDRPGFLSTGCNSGYAAVCLAVKLGAARVLLYGFDMREVGGRRRRFDYPAGLDSSSKFCRWIAKFEMLAPALVARKVEVLNCTPNSALKCFAFGTFEAQRKAG